MAFANLECRAAPRGGVLMAIDAMRRKFVSHVKRVESDCSKVGVLLDSVRGGLLLFRLG